MDMKLFCGRVLLLSLFSFVLLLAGCGDLTATDPAADGARYNRTYYYYYTETCRYNSVHVFDCTPVESISPSVKMSLRVDSDGLASLYLDGDRYYYTEREYEEGYEPDYGSYFRFFEDGDQLDIYKNGEVIAFWGDDGYVTYFYYDMPF